MKRFKMVIGRGLIVALLLQMLAMTAFAAGVNLALSATSGYAGDSVTISGTADPDEMVTIKALDGDGNIVYINAVLSASDGSYSDTFIVPDVEVGSLGVVAGYGSNVASADFTVNPPTSSDGGDSSTDENSTAQAVSVTFDETAKAYLKNLAGSGEIVLDIEKADITALFDEAKKRIGNRPVYQFSLTVADADVSSFGGGFAHVSIPYTPAVGEKTNKIVVYYLSDTHELAVIPNAIYDAASKTVKFSTSHFSVYAVGYNDVNFSDVSETEWYYDAVTFIAAREITNGTGNNMFSTNATLTRGQFTVMLMRAYGIEPDEDTDNNFDDAGDTYYTEYLAAAKRLGISNGIGDNFFAPNDNITRQDVFTLLYRALTVLGELPETDSSDFISDFSDTDEISDYAETAIETFVAAKIITGSDGMLMPQENSTRAQMAQVLYKMLSK